MRISDWSSDVCSSDLYVMSKRGEGQGFAAIGETLGISASRASQLYHEAVRLSEGPPVVPFNDVRLETPVDRLPLSRRVRRVLHHSDFRDRKSTRLNSSH